MKQLGSSDRAGVVENESEDRFQVVYLVYSKTWKTSKSHANWCSEVRLIVVGGSVREPCGSFGGRALV